MNVCEGLTRTARWLPDQTALVFHDRSITYAQLDRLSQAAADYLQQSGLQQGQRVALMLPNTPAFVVWYYAVLRLGAVAVSVSTRLTPREVGYVVSDCGATSVIALGETLQEMERELTPDVTIRVATGIDGVDVAGQPLTVDSQSQSTWVDADPDAAALILYTSGTTGFAKGATLSHRNVRTNVCAFNHLCGMESSDRMLLAVPLFHCFGQNALLNSAFNVGATLVLQERFDLNETRRLIQQHQVTQLYGVPMMFQLLHDSCEPGDLSSVDYCFSAAATLPIQVSRAWQQKFEMPIYEGYGLTETSPFASYNHRVRFVPGSIGTPIDGVEMKIVDSETGQDSARGDLGEIVIRGPNVMLGYWNRPDESAQAIRNGWFHSGDIGRMDEDGFFYIVDRVKDMISIGGVKVFPAEVERVFLDHPDISQIAIVGIPDPVFGEQVVAFIVSEAGRDSSASEWLDDVAGFAKENLSNFKIPRQFFQVDELPRNPSGKILKTKLRELAQQGKLPVATLQTNQPVTEPHRDPQLRSLLLNTFESERLRVATEFVQQAVQEIGQLDSLPEPSARFLEAGLDSLMIVELSGRVGLETGLGDRLPPTLVFDYPTISELAGFLLAQIFPSQPTAPSREVTPSEPEGDSRNLRAEIEEMTEEEVLQELLKEVDS
ncbi:MAG: AMP-binding protein [Planctomycetaceae bacterium]|nr:AMP-binding protein [Planctomycetaceae bacterium]MDG1807359.1 AMP-binding protein [Pirellulaceae bacterium]MDG2102647.1 AMP-binding protein [Pirellulaceae bacterium]